MLYLNLVPVQILLQLYLESDHTQAGGPQLSLAACCENKKGMDISPRSAF